MSKAQPTIQKYMTTQPYSIEPSESLPAALDAMKKWKIRHLPVVKGDEVVGILSDRDIKMIEGFEDVETEHLCVADVCVDKPFIVEPDSKLVDVAKEMASKHYGSAIVAQNKKLVGILTTVDICRALTEILETRFHE